MGLAKRMWMEMEEAKNILDSIYDYLKNGVSSRVEEHHYEILRTLSSDIQNNSVRELTFELLGPLAEKLDFHDFSEPDQDTISSLLERLNLINTAFDLSRDINETSQNSENYYQNKINELQKREIEFRQKLISNENKTEEQRRITKEKLIKIERELEQKKKELESKQREQDAKKDWSKKIDTTFEQLKTYLSPIQNEHKRLRILYYIFAGFSILTIVLIVIIEVIVIVKISKNQGYPNLKDYLTLFLPLPIAGALMWGFVFQMNRAQRQLLLLGSNIHSINYIQGLLISINNLSPDINDGVKRINDALDKIISNHLTNKSIPKESDLISLEKKDNVDVDKLIKIMKDLKSISN